MPAFDSCHNLIYDYICIYAHIHKPTNINIYLYIHYIHINTYICISLFIAKVVCGNSLIQLIDRYLSVYKVPDTILGSGNTAVDKTDTISALKGFPFWRGKD